MRITAKAERATVATTVPPASGALPAEPVLLITCEHGGNQIPPEHAHLFTGASEALLSHRGFDAGAAAVAGLLARQLGAHLIIALTSRLLVDLNRSPGHPRLFSEFTRDLPLSLRETILARHYFPHRQRVTAFVADAIATGQKVVHVASHSYAPVLDGITRNADIGILFDPRRAGEAVLCERWQATLKARYPMLRIRRNYPYRGTADGLATSLRRQFGSDDYAGVELEISQALIGGAQAMQLGLQLAVSLDDVIRSPHGSRTRG